MAKPQVMQRLQHGKLLTQKNFAQFVDTWNYIVERLEGIKGDYQIDPHQGHIVFDNTDPEHPVIRIRNLPKGGGGGGTGMCCNFAYDDYTDPEHPYIKDGCFAMGRKYIKCQGAQVPANFTDGWGILTISHSNTAVSGAVSFTTTDPFNANQSDSTTIIPLYEFETNSDNEFVVKVDYRGCPLVPVWDGEPPT